MVSADGTGLVSRAGTLLLRELTVETGLAPEWTEALLEQARQGKAQPCGCPGPLPARPPAGRRAAVGRHRGDLRHLPGRVLADLAVLIADGGDALTQLAVLRDQGKLFGVVASEPTAWRVVERVDAVHLDRLRAARAVARERAWAAGAGPDVAAGLTIDLDATVTVAHSEKENAAATWKKTYGLRFRAGGPRPGRPGNAGSNTAADHVSVLDMALAALPPRARPRPGDPACAAVLIRA